MRSLRHALLVAVAACLLLPSPSLAGGYSVSACVGYENASWSEWEPSPFATAYVACPGGALDLKRPQSNEGMMVRNVVGQGAAPRDAAAALRFDAPAGTTITGVDLDVSLTSNPGWDAGIHDATNDRWLWCGSDCWSSFDRWMHEELRGLSTQRIQALVRCAAARCRRDARHGFIAIRNAHVFLDDPSPPRLDGVRGSLAAAAGAWLRGDHDVAFDAADNSGIRHSRIELDDRAVHDQARWCDSTRPLPCADGAVGAAFDTRTWPDGEHVLRLSAQDAGGNWASVDRVVRVDNTAPAEPAPALAGGDGWSPQRARTLVLPLPGGQAAPLTRARVKACRVGGACEESAPELRAAPGGAAEPGAAAVPGASAAPAPAASSSPAATVPVAEFDGPGEYAVRVALEDAAGNVGPYAAPVTLRFDDARPGVPDVSAADAWRNGGALPLDALGQRPVSGIRGYRVRIGGREAIVATSFPLDELPEGGTPVEVSALSGAGLEGNAVRTTLKLDRSRPVIDATGAPDGWSRTPVTLALRGRDQPGLSGVRSLAWKVGEGAEATIDGDAAEVEIAEDGRHTVSYRGTDGAGNVSGERAVAVKIDRTPPETVAFEAPDPADPRRVRVVVADRTSGVASGRIELRRAGAAWRPVQSALADGRLVTLLDDATLRAGAYELRARVRDVAGNEAVGMRRVDGAPATLTLPLRRRTTLAVSRAGRLLRARLSIDASPARRSAATTGGEPAASRVPAAVVASPLQRAASAAADPLANREVTLSQRLRGRTKWRELCPKRTVIVATAAASGCTLRTDASGRVEVRLRAGPSRTLRIAFAGEALLLPASATSVVRTPARARLRATPRSVRAGGVVRFTGRLRGGHVPRAGKLVELQARVGAGWRTFATVRSDRRSRLQHTHRFAAGSAGRTYWFRLRIRRESAYPFETGTSRSVAVRVR